MACHECDLLQREMALAIGENARCRRCGATLYRCPPTTVDRSLALTLAVIVLFVVVNTFPIVGLSTNNTLVETTLFGAVRVLYDDCMWPLAGLVFATTLLMPLLDMAAVAYVLLPLKTGHIPRRPDIVSRVLRHVTPCGLTEVLILGMLVALVKLTAIATVVPGIAMWAFSGVMRLLVAAASTFDPHDMWSLIDRARSVQITGSAEEGKISPSIPTAARAGLFLCHGCGLLSKPAAHVHEGHCHRCSAGLHFRKPSIAGTWAFVIAAMVLYLLPTCCP
jgi:paraquat-inducible protein A